MSMGTVAGQPEHALTLVERVERLEAELCQIEARLAERDRGSGPSPDDEHRWDREIIAATSYTRRRRAIFEAPPSTGRAA
jgi:hypothetical protein